MKKLTIILLIVATATPAMAAQPGPNKKAIKTMDAAMPSGSKFCATGYIGYARFMRIKVAESKAKGPAKDGDAVINQMQQDIIADAYELRGRQWLNPNAKKGDPLTALPKDVDDNSNGSAANYNKYPDLAAKATSADDTMGLCDKLANIPPIDIEAVKKGK